MSNELPPRNVQRELVMQRIPVEMRSFVRQLTPNDRPLSFVSSVYSSSAFDESSPKADFEAIFTLFNNSGADTYKYLLGIAATAENAAQIHNALGAIAGIYDVVSDKRWDGAIQILDTAQTKFLKSTQVPHTVSEEARGLSLQMRQIYERNKSSRFTLESDLKDKLFSQDREIHAKYATALIEAYLYTILDPSAPIDLRRLLLNKSERLYFGHVRYHYENGQIDPMYDKFATYWRAVDASWVYPDIFGKRIHKNDKDFLLAELQSRVTKLSQLPQAMVDLQAQHENERAAFEDQITRLKAQLERKLKVPIVDPERLQQKIATLEAELTKLLSDVAYYKQRAVKVESIYDGVEVVLKSAAQRVELYKKIGGHPLDILGIPYGVWKDSSPKDRDAILTKAFRAGVKKYHYQIGENSPNYDADLAELKKIQFVRITQAKDFLTDHLNEDEF
ncbi:MAG: hypothetical protein AAB874_00415 [Patescibacteria group bacterium]